MFCLCDMSISDKWCFQIWRGFFFNDDSSCIKIGWAYHESYTHLWLLREISRVWDAELEFAKTWSSLAEMKWKKGSLHLSAPIIAAFFVNFVINFNENSHTQVTCCFTGLLDQAFESRKAPAAFMGFV